MRLRKHSWFNTKLQKEQYGIQAWDVKGKKWCHVFDDSGPCIYETEPERDAKMAEFNSQSAVFLGVEQ